MPKINQEEYEVLKGLDDKWKWIARDDKESVLFNNGVWVFQRIPLKERGYWSDNVDGHKQLSKDLFNFIQWEDEEPYNIAELIEEYESEETEVKDLEWLKKNANRTIDAHERYATEYSQGIVVSNKTFLMWISELDEPEVLSLDWISDNAVVGQYPDGMGYVVPAYKLQNQLVPKQDEREQLEIAYKDILDRGEFWFDDKKYKVVESSTLSEMEKVQLSQKTADELNRYKELGYSLKDLLVIAGSKQAQEKLARAWLDGYTVEKEQKYYVKMPKTDEYLTDEYGEVYFEGLLDWIGESPNIKQSFTKQEIKDYDERFLPFAVKLEELE